jgi:hypothetical protein
MHFDLKKPCDNCPFRSDIRPYLTKARVQQIVIALERATFACHKTTVDSEDEDGCSERVVTDDSQHCAGALIMLERTRTCSRPAAMAEVLGLYDPTELHIDSPVYDTFEAMIEAQER